MDWLGLHPLHAAGADRRGRPGLPALGLGAYIDASLTILGGLFHAAAYTFEGVIVPAMARMADRQPDMAALLDRNDSNPAAYPLFALMILFNLGLLIMAIGLWRKGLVPIWSAGLGGAATLAHLAPMPELVALILLTGFPSTLRGAAGEAGRWAALPTIPAPP